LKKWSLIAFVAVTLSSRGAVLPQAAPANFDDAKQTLAKGDYPRAESEFRSLLVANPRSPELMNDLGIALQFQGKSEEATRVFEKALKVKRLPETVALLAVAYCRNHQFDRATPLLKEARKHLADPNLMATLGPCLLEADQPEGAVVVYETLVRSMVAPEDENQANLTRAYFDLSRKVLDQLTGLPGGIKYARAIETSKQNGYADAKALFPEAYQHASYLDPSMPVEDLIPLLDTHPNDPSLLYVLGVESTERAADILDQIEDRWPDSIACKTLIAELQDAGGDRDGAILTYEQILATFPDAPPSVHFALGLMYAERRRWAEALQQYRLASGPGTASRYTTERISDALLNLDRNNEVMTLLRPIVDKPDAPAWALSDFGKAAQNTSQLNLALVYLKRSSDLEPENEALHYRLYLLYRDLKQPQSAATELASFKRLRGLKNSGQSAP
jgi:tetratricopeptide (TPR) repeat protein